VIGDFRVLRADCSCKPKTSTLWGPETMTDVQSKLHWILSWLALFWAAGFWAAGFWAAGFWAAGSWAAGSATAAATTAAATARQLDARFQTAGSEPRTQLDDAAYLRRVSLDLLGRAPRPAQIEQFSHDRRHNKRSAVVNEFLAKSQFGEHWGRYWRDVILARRSDERALKLVADGLSDAVAEKFNRGLPWDAIARDFITASGDVRTHGETGLFLAQKGEPEDITSEIARVFLGMQIQCAQCHDHPSDEWSREQFHQMAAFFPRVGVRRVRDTMQKNFEVFSIDQQRGRGKKRGNRLEHYMPDLENPQAPGTITKPVFFLTGQSLELGASDAQRRESLAAWVTDPEKNPWFARAYVNRIWAELIGRGFYEPVDDIGEGRDSIHPQILAFLAEQFTANDYDTRWLFRTIMATNVYQTHGDLQDKKMAASPGVSRPQPLRSDALYDSLASVLEVDRLETLSKNRGNKAKKAKQRGGKKNKVRNQFNQAFFYDPSLPRDEINPTIPQALLLMNSPQIDQLVRGDRPGTMLGRLLSQETDDQAVVNQLYLRCLSREPSRREQYLCLKYIKQTDNRTDAIEDILWSLLNTAEFRHRK
jgi:hypothetical protein